MEPLPTIVAIKLAMAAIDTRASDYPKTAHTFGSDALGWHFPCFLNVRVRFGLEHINLPDGENPMRACEARRGEQTAIDTN